MEARKNPILVGAVVAGLALAACGPSGEASSTASTVSGAVSADSTSVALRDSSTPARELSAAPADGTFSFDVSGLTPPFALRAEGGEGSLYTMVTRGGNADVNELTNAAVASATGGMGMMDDDAWSGGRMHYAADRMSAALRGLRTVLKPLFDLYGVTRIGGDDEGGDPNGMRALLRDVSFTVTNGTFTVTNRATGGVIYSAPLTAIASGTFHPENMPAGPGGGTVTPPPPPPPPPAACTYTYSAWGACQSNGTQTRTMTSATPAGCTGTPVLSQACTYTPPPPPPPAACTYTYSAWGACQSNGTQTRTMTSATPAGCTGTPVLSQACTYTPPPPPPPAACTYTYSAWGACQSSNTQVRTVVSSTPVGCTGTPVLSQACTYTPPVDGATLYGQKCASCHGALASSSLKGINISVSMIKSRGMTQGLNDTQLQAIVSAVGP